VRGRWSGWRRTWGRRDTKLRLDSLLPALQGAGSETLASLAATVNGRYGNAIAVMERMGWSWTELCTAPGDLVEELETRLAAEQRWTEKKRAMGA